MKRKVILLLGLLILLSGCTSRNMVSIKDHRILLKIPDKKIGKAILLAGFSRGWLGSIVEPGHIVSKIIVRNKHTVVLDIYYTSESYSIEYKDSKNMNYKEKRIHRSYNSWIKNLSKDIDQELFRSGLSG